ncbi:hypothetical protein Ancab_005454 [Ancistrocladus abbreviatus]
MGSSNSERHLGLPCDAKSNDSSNIAFSVDRENTLAGFVKDSGNGGKAEIVVLKKMTMLDLVGGYKIEFQKRSGFTSKKGEVGCIGRLSKVYGLMILGNGLLNDEDLSVSVKKRLVGRLLTHVKKASLFKDKSDGWRWDPGRNGTYFAKSTCGEL